MTAEQLIVSKNKYTTTKKSRLKCTSRVVLPFARCVHLTICTERQQIAFQISLLIQMWIGLALMTLICQLMLQLGSVKATTSLFTDKCCVLYPSLLCTRNCYVGGKLARLNSKWGKKPNPATNPPFSWSNTVSNRIFYELGSPAAKHWGTGFVCRFTECQCLLKPICMQRLLQDCSLPDWNSSAGARAHPAPGCAAAAAPRKCRSSKQHNSMLRSYRGGWDSGRDMFQVPSHPCCSLLLTALP